MVRRYGLRDDQWEKIENLLPGREVAVGVTAKDNRLFVEAVLYRYRAGIPWRDLPERFGDFRVIHTRHTRWSQRGVWKRVFERALRLSDGQIRFVRLAFLFGLTMAMLGLGGLLARALLGDALYAPGALIAETRMAIVFCVMQHG